MIKKHYDNVIKVEVIGCMGSGKSFLCRQLKEQLDKNKNSFIGNVSTDIIFNEIKNREIKSPFLRIILDQLHSKLPKITGRLFSKSILRSYQNISLREFEPLTSFLMSSHLFARGTEVKVIKRLAYLFDDMLVEALLRSSILECDAIIFDEHILHRILMLSIHSREPSYFINSSLSLIDLPDKVLYKSVDIDTAISRTAARQSKAHQLYEIERVIDNLPLLVEALVKSGADVLEVDDFSSPQALIESLKIST